MKRAVSPIIASKRPRPKHATTQVYLLSLESLQSCLSNFELKLLIPMLSYVGSWPQKLDAIKNMCHHCDGHTNDDTPMMSSKGQKNICIVKVLPRVHYPLCLGIILLKNILFLRRPRLVTFTDPLKQKSLSPTADSH